VLLQLCSKAKTKPGHKLGLVVKLSICLSVKGVVFKPASCVFVTPFRREYDGQGKSVKATRATQDR